ncbi:hypothetical protein MKX03_012827 [Papaver bracteatum]|nr:hypothetical protein MKX03_012827 [Papaver bracteatum]
MGKRGKVQLKRIENKNNRQVSFSKRKPIALIVFSPKGELFEYPTDAWYVLVKDKVEVLQRNQRYNQFLYESIYELQRKEKDLKEQNTVLGEKIKEKEQELGTSGQHQCNQVQAQNTCPKAQNSPTIIFS